MLPLPHLEATIHLLNHQSSRSLHGQTPCEFFHNQACRLRLLLTNYWETIATTPNQGHSQCRATWRHTVESWLRRQGLIEVRLNHEPKVSTVYQLDLVS